ncbi:CHAT domain-containing protein [Oculatella sp. LEGE 06141]|uniref:CHAT domain-containing protein n=1 Tax=Oculatella sp. LEGE 06141 TaxID=1828648 RepID=UPI00187F1EAD|nr:CHAT domain-containing protein [Oculatella sp. LEGE 06141]MBE9181073.1 CHAT domain-containing protein [Oculatella sp. LEGE 06141]
MPLFDSPCLSLAIARLTAAEPEHYAIWVLQAPYPGGYVHHDRRWPQSLTQTWQAWQNLFSLRDLPPTFDPEFEFTIPPGGNQGGSHSSRLMQHLGVSLWQWLLDGPIQSSFDRSQGIAIGQSKPLRFRLEVRDPDLIAVPWEVMQLQSGMQAVSLSQQILFSRTTSYVGPLPPQRQEQSLKILLVLGNDSETLTKPLLKLEQEAIAIAQTLERAATNSRNSLLTPVMCQVETLVQPTPAQLIAELERGNYNVMFYAGHGEPAPDGGLLFLRPDAALNGTELAQVLTRCQVKLAVFNACWGAQPEQQEHRAIPRSSLAEVLIHHGVPSVLAMRDTIADQEALDFIQVFVQALAERSPIDEAVAIARQHLLTVYKFNQPAWTLPVLYMHPEFNGELIKPITEGVTEIPDISPSWLEHQTPAASLRTMAAPNQIWSIRGGMMRVGSREGNDLVLREPGVSREHAEIFYRASSVEADSEPMYLLRDRSRYGTWILGPGGWHKVHHQEVPLRSKTQIKFGNPRSQALEFVIDGSTVSS